jgi:hypothetical protein
MSVCERAWSDGRWLNNKMISKPAMFTDEARYFAEDAVRGSALLRDAIFRSAGFIVPAAEPIAPPPFKPTTTKRGKPRKRGRQPVIWQESRVIAQIIALVAIRYGSTSYELIGRSRVRTVAVPRNLAMFLARKIEHASFASIGKQFGGRDHSTVVNAVNEAEELIAGGDAKAIATIWAVQKAVGG